MVAVPQARADIYRFRSPSGNIALDQGTPPAVVCNSDTLRNSALPTLSYGSTCPVNPISCVSRPSGITCSDATSGHYFRVSRDSYELH